MAIAVKHNNWRQSRGSWSTIVRLASSCLGALAGEILHSVPGANQGVAAARPMDNRWLCLCTAITDALTQQEGICTQR
jgi:hypothetical protein